ncbi:MAG: TldD/PmbA family protein [Myxococcales bacterium]|nr:TldD/PmbA family protein [Myxococcales bacterium]
MIRTRPPATPRELADDLVASRLLPSGCELFVERHRSVSQSAESSGRSILRRSSRVGLSVRLLDERGMRLSATSDCSLAGARRAVAALFGDEPPRIDGAGGERLDRAGLDTLDDARGAEDDASAIWLDARRDWLQRTLGDGSLVELKLRRDERAIALSTFDRERLETRERSARLEVTLVNPFDERLRARERLDRFGADGADESSFGAEALLEAATRARRRLEDRLCARPFSGVVRTLYFPPHRFGRVVHEILGHRLEADFALIERLSAGGGASQSSLGRVGQRVAPDWCTLVDDGDRASGPTSRIGAMVDDEGTPRRRSVLVREGRLERLLCDRRHATLLGCPPSGSGRRASYADPPLPRMTVLALGPGVDDEESLRQRAAGGLFIDDVEWGRLDVASGRVRIGVSRSHVGSRESRRPIEPFVLVGSVEAFLGSVCGLGPAPSSSAVTGRCRKQRQTLQTGWSAPAVLCEPRPGEIELIPTSGSRSRGDG